MHSDSVYRLVDELVESIGAQYCARVDVKTVKKCKSQAFGILLGKAEVFPGAGSTGQPVAECADTADPLAMLECHHFEMQMTSRYKYQLERCERFERLLDQVRSFATDDDGPALVDPERAVLQFLLSLKNSTTDCSDILAEVSNGRRGKKIAHLSLLTFAIYLADTFFRSQ